ncbi:MAG: DUF1800 domain-containing protein [Chloroflexota bacterium]
MTLSRRNFIHIGSATAAIGAAAAGGVGVARRMTPAAQASTTTAPQNIHLLNRISYGATPQSIAEVNTLGYDAYLEQQLNPHQIDDSAANAKLAPYTAVLNLAHQQLLRQAEGRIEQSLPAAAILRAAHSRRQLQERMVEFWSDHFNAVSEDILFMMPTYYNRDIRDNALGNFRSLVLATAKSPAMLIYLDNFVNVARHPNENYARELLELHTMGVDGGYTEADVEAVARAFTGWTVNEATENGFIFDPTTHDTDPKTLLGHNLPGGRGIEDGLHVIDIVCRHPATAQFISRKLCIKFVSDRPPQSLVDSTAAVFTANNGEIKPVLRHLFTSPQFKAATGQKFRRPFDFYIAALRSSGATITQLEMTHENLETLGQRPYGWLPPNGYPAVATPWLTTNGLLSRWNIAMRMTEASQGGDDTGLRVTLHEEIGNPVTVGELVSTVSLRVFGYVLPAPDLQTYVAYASDETGASTPVTPALLSRKLGTLFGLMMASPQFQWI